MLCCNARILIGPSWPSGDPLILCCSKCGRHISQAEVDASFDKEVVFCRDVELCGDEISHTRVVQYRTTFYHRCMWCGKVLTHIPGSPHPSHTTSRSVSSEYCASDFGFGP